MWFQKLLWSSWRQNICGAYQRSFAEKCGFRTLLKGSSCTCILGFTFYFPEIEMGPKIVLWKRELDWLLSWHDFDMQVISYRTRKEPKKTCNYTTTNIVPRLHHAWAFFFTLFFSFQSYLQAFRQSWRPLLDFKYEKNGRYLVLYPEQYVWCFFEEMWLSPLEHFSFGGNTAYLLYTKLLGYRHFNFNKRGQAERFLWVGMVLKSELMHGGN